MRLWIIILLLTTASILGCRNNQDNDIAKKGNPEILFDGSSLKGWKTTPGSKWLISENMLTPDMTSQEGMIVTHNEYSNFRLTLEFLVDKHVNSGVFIRCNNNEEITPFKCYELNIWDEHPNQEFRTGAIVFHVAPPLNHVNTVGKWNTFEIIAIGNHITTKINGVVTAELDDNTHINGFLALQWGGEGSLQFKNILLQTL